MLSARHINMYLLAHWLAIDHQNFLPKVPIADKVKNYLLIKDVAY